jgi:serine/threonine-protein kinase
MDLVDEERRQRLRRLFDLFGAAVELEASARAYYVAQHTADDPDLREKLERLLQRDHQLKDVNTVSALDRLASELPELTAERDWSGTQLGRYELIEEIGRGGMGRVYRARRVDGAFEQQVAVKLVARNAMNPALLRRFSNERRVLAALDHPGICRLLDAGSADDETPWVAMELVRGQPISTWCDALKLDLHGRLRIFRQVLAATAHAHRNLVVHRDIKPSNILVDSAGNAKLLDFGIAKPLRGGADAHSTSTAERYFTLTHAAPEQWLGGPITVSCDIYALGVLLFELLTGNAPFQFRDLSPGQIERLILETPAPKPSRAIFPGDPKAARARRFTSPAAWRQSLRGDLDAIVGRALRKEVGARYPSVEQFDADIAAFLEQRPVAAREGQRWYRTRKFVRRNRLLLAGLSIALLAAISLSAVILVQTLQVHRERDRAEQAIRFLKDAFYAADPARSAEGDVSARQIMATARGDLESLRAEYPALYANIGSVIADVELGLGLSESAATLAAQVLHSGAAELNEAQDLRLLMARADTLAGRLDSAAAALADYQSAGGAQTPELLVERGLLAVQQREHSRALADFTQAVSLTADAPAADHTAFRARIELANLQRILQQPEAALATLDDLLRDQRAQLPAGHPNLTLTRLRRIDSLRRIGRGTEAVHEAQAAVDAVAQTYGREVPVYASALSSLGNALLTADQPGAAAQAYEEALELQRKHQGSEHASTLRTQYNLVLALAGAYPKDARADMLFAQVIEAGKRAFGADSQTLAFQRAGYAQTLVERQRHADALQLLIDIPPVLLRTAPAHLLKLIQSVLDSQCTDQQTAVEACRTLRTLRSTEKMSMP